MRKYFISIFLTLILSFGGLFNVVAATWQPGELTIITLKMTSNETIVIGNTSDQPINLQNYLIHYFNKSSPTSFITPTSIQALPDFVLNPKQSFLISGDSAATCGSAGVANLSMSLSDTAGYISLVKVSQQADNSILYTPQDHVNWTSSASGADLVKVPSATVDPKAVWYRKVADGTWQQASLGSDCTLFLTLSAVVPSGGSTYIEWAEGEEPPAVIIKPGSAEIIDEAKQYNGLAAPKITELLPNPAEPQTDSEDEFIEIYNPNDIPFDLSGFKLQVGTAGLRSYSFPEGTMLPAKGFSAFLSSATGLSLTNNGGQVRLIDPFNSLISQTEVYSTAKDGQSWALADGKWYFTITPTPNSSNIIKQPLTVKTLTVGSTKKAPTTKKAAATKTTKPKVKSAKTKKAKVQTASAIRPAEQTSPAPVHFWVLAGIGSAAVMYALYEYRNDLANTYYRFKKRVQKS